MAKRQRKDRSKPSLADDSADPKTSPKYYTKPSDVEFLNSPKSLHIPGIIYGVIYLTLYEYFRHPPCAYHVGNVTYNVTYQLLLSLGTKRHESWYFFMLKCRESWCFFSSVGAALIHCHRKKNFWEPAKRSTVLGSSSGLDHRIRTAFMCRCSFRVSTKRARTKRLVPKQTKFSQIFVRIFYQESAEAWWYLYTQYATESTPSRRHVDRRYRPLLTAIYCCCPELLYVSWPTAVRSRSCSQRIRRMVCLCLAVPDYL